MLLENALADFVELLFNREHNTTTVISPKLLQVHYDNYFHNLTAALKHHYPMTQVLLGHDFFDMLCIQYINNYPSLSPELQHYGSYFSTFLMQHPRMTALEYVSDLARLEWACQALPAEDEFFTCEDLLAINEGDYDKIHVELNPSVRLISSQYPLMKLIAYCKTEAPSPFEITIDPCHLLIMNTKKEVTILSLTDGEASFFNDLLNESSLSHALNNTLSKDSTFKLEETLVTWINKKIIQKIHLML